MYLICVYLPGNKSPLAQPVDFPVNLQIKKQPCSVIPPIWPFGQSSYLCRMQERTEIASLGEFGLIDHLTKNNETRQVSTVLSVGDDAAVIDHFGKQTVVSTDLLIEGIHFDLMYTPLRHLGYKSVVVNLSDIYAMNAVPTQITMSIGFSNRFSLEALNEFYEGVYAACERYNVDLIGGDTSTHKKVLLLA